MSLLMCVSIALSWFVAGISVGNFVAKLKQKDKSQLADREKGGNDAA